MQQNNKTKQKNMLIFFIITIPLVEIYIMIKIGHIIGAFNTIFLIVFTAFAGIYYAKLEGLNTLRSGFQQLVKNEVPFYEIISGAALALAAVLLIFPGFVTDIIGLMLIIPPTRKLFIKFISSKMKKKEKNEPNIIEGEYEETTKKDNKK